MKVIPNFKYGQYCLILSALSATVEFDIDENCSIGNSVKSTNLRIRFGFGQAQSKLNKQYWAYDLKKRTRSSPLHVTLLKEIGIQIS